MRLAVAVIAVMLALPGQALAAECPKASTSDIADEVMCLQCGVPLNLAENAPSAIRQRAFIQQQVDQCKSKDEIKDALVAQFGSNVLADPEGDATWLVPVLLFAAAVAGLGFGALRWRRRRGSAPKAAATPAPATGDGDAARLQADIDRYEL